MWSSSWSPSAFFFGEDPLSFPLVRALSRISLGDSIWDLPSSQII